MTTYDIIFMIYLIIGVLLVIPTYICTRLSVRLWPRHNPFCDEVFMIIPTLGLCFAWGLWPIIALLCGLNYGFEKILNKFFPRK